MIRLINSLNHLRNSKGQIVDYSSARITVRERAINYYGVAGGGPWIGYQGPPTALYALASAGNIIALCGFDGSISEKYAISAIKALEQIYNEVAFEVDPF